MTILQRMRERVQMSASGLLDLPLVSYSAGAGGAVDIHAVCRSAVGIPHMFEHVDKRMCRGTWVM